MLRYCRECSTTPERQRVPQDCDTPQHGAQESQQRVSYTSTAQHQAPSCAKAGTSTRCLRLLAEQTHCKPQATLYIRAGSPTLPTLSPPCNPMYSVGSCPQTRECRPSWNRRAATHLAQGIGSDSQGRNRMQAVPTLAARIPRASAQT